MDVSAGGSGVSLRRRGSQPIFHLQTKAAALLFPAPEFAQLISLSFLLRVACTVTASVLSLRIDHVSCY